MGRPGSAGRCLSSCIWFGWAICLVVCAHASRPTPRELHLRGLELLHGSGNSMPDPEGAARTFKRMTKLQPSSSAAYHNLAVSLQGAAQHLVGPVRRAALVEAADTYKSSLAFSSSPMFHSYYNLALLLHDEFAGKDEAAKVGRIAQQLAPNAPESNAAMGVIDLLKQKYGEAHRWFTKSLHLRRGPPLASNTSQLTKSLQNGFLGSSYDDIGKQSRRNSNRLGSWGEADDGGLLVALHKLEHDAEQLEYQLSGHLLPRDLHSTMQHELAVLQSSITELRKRLQPVHMAHADGRVTQVGRQGLASLQPAQADVLAKLLSHQHLTYVEPPTSMLPQSALSLKTPKERVSLQRQYNSGISSSVIAVDDLLTPQARKKLYHFAMESNIFHQQKMNGYLGSQLDDGFTSPLLFQIAHELQELLPTVFKGHRLMHAWAYKYDSDLREGIEAHADQAAVNCNIWITPEEENIGPEGTGGLVVFKVVAPGNWSFADFNNRASGSRIQALIDSDGRRNNTIPYRSNRAVIFHSSLFHQTDKFMFRKGYKSRRINVTLLFGKKGEHAFATGTMLQHKERKSHV